MTDNRLLLLILVFAPLSILSFGGGQATVPEIQHQTVGVHGWLADTDFADLYAVSRASPGPSTLIVALIGWQVAGFFGALVATIAIFLPSSIIVYFAGSWWARNEHSNVRKAIERGLAPIAVGLIFAGALIVFTSAHAGLLGFVTTAIVCLVLSLTKTSQYTMVAAIACVYSLIYVLLPISS